LVVLKRGAAPRLRGSRQCLVLVGWLVILKRGAAPRLRGSRQCSELPTERADSERRPRRLPRCDHRTAPSSVPPSTSRVARAAPPPAPAHALQHTLGVARGAVPHAVAGPLAHTPEQPAPHSGCRVRRCARAPPPRMASHDSHERPVPHAPHLPPSQRGPHLSCPCAAHLIWSPSRRQGGAVEEPQSDAMDVDSTMEARPHAPPTPA
jgi:hypothetical protein